MENLFSTILRFHQFTNKCCFFFHPSDFSNFRFHIAKSHSVSVPMIFQFGPGKYLLKIRWIFFPLCAENLHQNPEVVKRNGSDQLRLVRENALHFNYFWPISHDDRCIDNHFTKCYIKVQLLFLLMIFNQCDFKLKSTRKLSKCTNMIYSTECDSKKWIAIHSKRSVKKQFPSIAFNSKMQFVRLM